MQLKLPLVQGEVQLIVALPLLPLALVGKVLPSAQEEVLPLLPLALVM